MTAAPPSPSPATLIAQDEMAERMRTCLLGLAAHAMAMAERLMQEAGVTTSFRPLAWLFAGRSRRRGRRIRVAARTLQALAAMFEPASDEADASENPPLEAPRPAAAAAPFTWPHAPVCPPTEHPAPPVRLCKASPAAFSPRAHRPHSLPPRPRLLPPPQAAPPVAPSLRAA